MSAKQLVFDEKARQNILRGVEKLAKAEAAKVSISTALAKHEEGVKTVKAELEKQTKELAAAQDRQKKSGEQKKNLEKNKYFKTKNLEIFR